MAKSAARDTTVVPSDKLGKSRCKKLHVEYEHIHPFADGNGRTGRIFMNWTRVKRCNLPPLVIYEKDKRDYYEWFR